MAETRKNKERIVQWKYSAQISWAREMMTFKPPTKKKSFVTYLCCQYELAIYSLKKFQDYPI